MPRTLIDLTSQRFGRLLVLRKEALPMPRQGSHYVCQCDCGSVKTIHMSELRNGDTQSCGCLHKQIAAEGKYKHGLRKHPIYKSWAGMKNRCLNPDSDDYAIYGGRGISVCGSWLESFEAFAKDMLPSWQSGLSLERIDSNKDYSPDNCIWATAKTQANNRRTSVRVLFDGNQYTQKEFSEKFNIPFRTVQDRISRGKLKQVFLYPSNSSHSKKTS